MSAPAFDFSKLPRPDGYRRTYGGLMEAFNRGLLSHGFMWELARRDEVFGAFLKKNGVEKP